MTSDEGSREPRRFITLANTKGGVGKTTSAIGTAWGLHKRGYKVEVRDLDPQGSASLWSYNASQHGAPLPFPVTVANRFTVGADADDNETWVIIDTPPSQVDLIAAALDASSLAILVSTPGALDLARLKETADNIACPSSVLLTQVKTNTKSLQNAERFLKENDLSRFDTMIRFLESIRRASDTGVFPSASGYESVAGEILEIWDLPQLTQN